MQKFYIQAVMIGAALLVASVGIAYWGSHYTSLTNTFLPSEESRWPWEARVESDAIHDGSSSVALVEDEVDLSFKFSLSNKNARYPYAQGGIFFSEGNNTFTPSPNPLWLHHADLSQYDTLTFKVRCTPDNTLSFYLLTVDENITKPDDMVSYRRLETYFSCSNNWQRMEVDLTRLQTPAWWFSKYGIDYLSKDYTLSRVPKLLFSSSFQSLVDVPSEVQIDNITLTANEDWPETLAAGVVLLLWGVFIVGFTRLHTVALTRSLTEKLQKDLPLVAYQQLTVESSRDKSKDALLRHLATEYCNPDLSVDDIVKTLGIGRTKIYETLKSELGYTFSGYVNKLRLTEAARLLQSSSDTSVAEIAHRVGYNNASYFNKLFKQEYGCAPKTFILLCSKPGEADSNPER